MLFELGTFVEGQAVVTPVQPAKRFSRVRLRVHALNPTCCFISGELAKAFTEKFDSWQSYKLFIYFVLFLSMIPVCHVKKIYI